MEKVDRPAEWAGLARQPRRMAMKAWLVGRGWRNHGGAKGVFVLDELGEDGPTFSLVAAVDFELAGRPKPRPRPTLESVPDPDASSLPCGIGGGTPGLDPWVDEEGR